MRKPPWFARKPWRRRARPFSRNMASRPTHRPRPRLRWPRRPGNRSTRPRRAFTEPMTATEGQPRAESARPLIEAEGLRHRYGGREVLALPSLALSPGAEALLLGRS